MKRFRAFAVVLLILLTGPLLALFDENVDVTRDWRTANRDSAGIAPAPETIEDAVVQVYAARTFGWRGVLAVHTWIATKEHGADHYLVHHVMGWRARWGQPVVVSSPDVPDRHWYGSRPELLFDRRGPVAQTMIPAIISGVESYPYPDHYVMWPGPNSNTFVAHVARSVPGMEIDLPVTAIGKDHLGEHFVSASPSNTGFQFSAWGLLGLTVGRKEGLELNILGLVFGIDPLSIAIKLPGVGRIGLPQSVS